MSQPKTHNQIYRSTEIEVLSLSALRLPEKVVRLYPKHAKRLAARQIEEFGVLIPILIDENDVIRGGTLYFLAAQLLRLADIPVVRATHLSEAQLRAYTIAEQRLSELPTWDPKAVAAEFEFLTALDIDFDIEITGFSVTEVDNLIASASTIDTEDDPPAIVAEKPVSRIGDVWKLDAHRLICGSSLDQTVWTSLMGSETASLIFTDPPYNVKIDGHVSGKGKFIHREFAMASGEMSPAEYREFLRTSLRLAHDHSADGALHYICIDWRHIEDVVAIGGELYAKLINICCWVKHNGGMGSFYRSRHELIPVFRKGSRPHRNNIELGRHGRNRTNVWEYAGATSFAGRVSGEGNTLEMHPTAKPVTMIADAILDSTIRNAIVADPFLGSGATLMAAERVGRRLYGIELDPLYVDVAIRRWQQHTGQDAIHLETGQSFREREAFNEQTND